MHAPARLVRVVLVHVVHARQAHKAGDGPREGVVARPAHRLAHEEEGRHLLCGREGSTDEVGIDNERDPKQTQERVSLTCAPELWPARKNGVVLPSSPA